MKKTYIIPAVQVVKMHATSMLATSEKVNLGDAENYSGGGTLTGTKGNAVGNIWDDDDEE